MNNDSLNLLKECNAGIKMGSNAIKKVLPKVKSEHLRRTLEECNSTHAELGDKTHSMLLSAGADTKPPHAIASIMSDMKISMKLMMRESDTQVAELMTDGCNMGVKSLSRYLNKYGKASERSKEIARQLIDSEDHLAEELRSYL